jgi:putative phosphoribosyl transferase
MTRAMASKLRVVSYSSKPFSDREEAGMLLARELVEYRGQNPVVLGILRGGMIVASVIASELNADLDIILAHKLRTPGHEELAMGSVAEDGKLFINQEVVRELMVHDSYIEQEKAVQLAEIKRRAEIFRHVWQKIPLKDRIVIVVDDGVATGATTQAALWAVQLEEPVKLIAAIPVGPVDTIKKLTQDVDEMICLRAPELFVAVGQFYMHFNPVEDEDVLTVLRKKIKRDITKHRSGI